MDTTTIRPAYADDDMVMTAVAASIVGLAKNTLEKMRVYGGGPRFVKYRAAVRYSVRDLRVWIAANSAASTGEHCPTAGIDLPAAAGNA